MRILEARLIDDVGAQRGDLADRDRLVTVGERGAPADGIQSAHPAGIRTVDIIEAVADLQQVPVIEAIVAPHKEIVCIVPGRGETRRDPGALV